MAAVKFPKPFKFGITRPLLPGQPIRGALVSISQTEIDKNEDHASLLAEKVYSALEELDEKYGAES